MAIAQSENVTNHGHDTQRSRVIRPPLKPGLRALTLEPKHTVQIFACGVIHSVTKDFDLLHESEIVIVRGHLKHDPMLNVEQNTAALTVFLDESM